MSCREPREIPFSMIIVARTDDPSGCPKQGALIKKCSRCGYDVWVAPRTVKDTGLRVPLVCWGCFYTMVEEVPSGG